MLGVGKYPKVWSVFDRAGATNGFVLPEGPLRGTVVWRHNNNWGRDAEVAPQLSSCPSLDLRASVAGSAESLRDE